MTVRDLRKFIDYIMARVRQKFRPAVRGELVRVVSKSDGIYVQLSKTALEQAGDDKKELFQQFGFRSAPIKGTKAVVIFIGGHPDQPIIIATDKPPVDVPACPDGGVQIYVEGGEIFVSDKNRNGTFKCELLKLTEDANAGVARVGDKVESDIGLDFTFWNWISQAHSKIPWGGPPPTMPESLTSKVTSGSDKVLVDDEGTLP